MSEQKAPRVPRDSHSVPDQVRVGGGARWAPGGREGESGELGSRWERERVGAGNPGESEEEVRELGTGVFRSVWTGGTERRLC